MYDNAEGPSLPRQMQTNMNSGVGMQATSGLAVPPPRSEIAAQLEISSKAGHVIHDMIDQLESRLSPVLLPMHPENAKEGGSCASGSTQIAAILAEHNQRLGGAIGRLQTLIDRIGV